MWFNPLTAGNTKRHNYVLASIVAADALVLKHQVISIHNTDSIIVVPKLYHKNGYFWWKHTQDIKFILKKNEPVLYG